jgi:hypothetical protein
VGLRVRCDRDRCRQCGSPAGRRAGRKLASAALGPALLDTVRGCRKAPVAETDSLDSEPAMAVTVLLPDQLLSRPAGAAAAVHKTDCGMADCSETAARRNHSSIFPGRSGDLLPSRFVEKIEILCTNTGGFGAQFAKVLNSVTQNVMMIPNENSQ